MHQEQISEGSHLDFFRNQKQKVKRAGALTKAVELAAQRVSPGAHAGVRQVKDEEFFRLNKMYQDAFAKGEHRQCVFQPLSAYQHKITPKIRPILAGEIGVYGAQILTLEPGYGTGNLVQVPTQIGGGDVSGNQTGTEESDSSGDIQSVGQDGSVQPREDALPVPTDGGTSDT